jgi:hypothetical protein
MTTRSLLPVLPATWKPPLAAVVAIASSMLLASCAGLYPLNLSQKPAPEPVVAEKKPPPPPEPIKPPPPSRLYEWKGSDDYISRIEISINEQKARFYRGDKEVGWTTVASGLVKRPTPVGSFAVMEKVQDKRSNLYGRIYNKNGKLVKRNADLDVDSIPAGGRFEGASMPYFLRLTGDGIGMHAGPIPHPGRRASHGCIRMPKKFAPILYRYVSVGTPVTIKGNGPSYASYLSKQRKSAPKRAPAVSAQPESAVASVARPASSTPAKSAGPPQPTVAAGGAATASGSADVTTPATTERMAPTEGMPPAQSPGVAAASETTSSERAAPPPTAAPADTGPAPTSPGAAAVTEVSGTPTRAETEPTPSEGASSVPGGTEQKPVAGAEPPAVSQEAQVKPVAAPSAEGTMGATKGAPAPAPAGGSETGGHPSAAAEATAPPAQAPAATQSSEG